LEGGYLGHVEEHLDNPFEAPQVDPISELARATAYAGPWAEGPRVVARSGARWPARCAKCNAASDQVWRIHWSGVPRSATFFLLFGILIYVVVYLTMRSPAVIVPSLCATHRRRAWLWTFTVFGGAVAAGLVAAAASAAYDQPALAVVALGTFAAPFVVRPAPLRMVEVNGDRVRVRGVGPDFLRSLPPLTPQVELRLRTREDLLSELDP
jgi:hypothetical protein